MESSRFDDLTKALATSASRRQALRRMGAILGGTALAGLFPGLAFASNSACAHFCAAVFGADTPAAGQCTSEAAHGKGLCYTCGSTTPPSSICCTRNASGYCTGYSSATCCTSDQTCQTNGTCQSCTSQCNDGCSDTGPYCCPGMVCCNYGTPGGVSFCCPSGFCSPGGFCTAPGC